VRAVDARRIAEEERATPPLGPRGALLAGGVCYVAVVTSHQLSPVLTLASVALLAALTRRVPLGVPAAMAAIEVWWLVLAWPFVRTHFSLIDPGAGGAAAPDRNLGAALPGAAFTFYAPAAVMALVTALALVGIARRVRAGRWDLAPACFIGAPVLAVAIQSYGGEGAYRAYLFALPWLAFFAAHACTRPMSPLFAEWLALRFPTGARLSFGRLITATTVVSACLLFAYFGQELVNRIPSDDVRAAVWYEQHAAPGSIRIDLAPSSPGRLTARYPLVSLGDPSSLLEQPGFAGHRLGTGDVPRLLDVIQRQGAHPAYVVVSRAQENYGRLNGLLPKGSVDSFAQALKRSPSFRLAYQRPSVWIFEHPPGEVARAGTGPDRLVTR
jgi:hypothetical protein